MTYEPICKDELILVSDSSIPEIKWRNIESELNVTGHTFTNSVSFKNCHFSNAVDLSNCHFEKGLEFVDCVFESRFKLVGAVVKGDCEFRACLFEDDANFDRLQVMGILEVRAPKERTVLNVNKELTNSDDSNSPSIFMLQPWVIFKKEARFSQIHVKGEANFGSAQFEGWADFYNAKIEGPAFFV